MTALERGTWLWLPVLVGKAVLVADFIVPREDLIAGMTRP